MAEAVAPEKTEEEIKAVNIEEGISRLEEQVKVRDEMGKLLFRSAQNNASFSIPQLTKVTKLNSKTAVPVLQNLQTFGLLKIVRNNLKKRQEYQLVWEDKEVIAGLKETARVHHGYSKTYRELGERFDQLVETLEQPEEAKSPKD